MAKVLKAAWKLPAPVTLAATLDSVIVVGNLVFPIPSFAANGVQIPRSEMVAMLTAWKAAFTAAKLILFTGNPELGPSMDFTVLAEPTASWYAEKTTVLGAIHDGSGSFLYLGCSSAEWDYSGVDPPTTVTGAALIDVTA